MSIKNPRTRKEKALAKVAAGETLTPRDWEEKMIAEAAAGTDPRTAAREHVDLFYQEISGGGVTVEPLSVTSNDTYTAPDGSAYSPVAVNVPPYVVGYEDYDTVADEKYMLKYVFQEEHYNVKMICMTIPQTGDGFLTCDVTRMKGSLANRLFFAGCVVVGSQYVPALIIYDYNGTSWSCTYAFYYDLSGQAHSIDTTQPSRFVYYVWDSEIVS